MRTTYLPVRVLALAELDAFCYVNVRAHAARTYSIERVSRSRVTVSVSDGEIRAEAVLPCYPGADGVRVVLDPLRVLCAPEWETRVRGMFAPLLEGSV